MDYKKNINVFSFWKVRHVELRLKVGVCGSEDRAEMMPSLYICNKSISSSSFPTKWKEAKVSPLHKQGPSDNVNNYRPISILPILSKILERHVSDCLLHYLNENDLLHVTQSGFRAQHSCETALTHMIHRCFGPWTDGRSSFSRF